MNNTSNILVCRALAPTLRWGIAGMLLLSLVLPASKVYALSAEFFGRVPRFGSVTLPQDYVTKSNLIQVKMAKNQYDLWVKAVRCDGRGDVSSYKRWIPANSHNEIPVAKNVRVGTCFRLNFDAPTRKYFDIAGRVSY